MPLWDESPRSPSGSSRKAPDWIGWVALGWAVAFGLLYAQMIVASRFPAILVMMRRLLPDGS